MAITVGTPQNTTGTNVNATDTVTISSFAVSANPNRVLIAFAAFDDDSGLGDLSGVSFNTSEAFTLHHKEQHTGAAAEWSVEIWYLVAPSNATADVVFTVGTGTGVECVVGVVECYGASQDADPFRADGDSDYGDFNEVTSSAYSHTIDSVAGDVVFSATVVRASRTNTATETGLIDAANGTTDANPRLGVSHTTAAGATTSLEWTVGGGFTRYAIAMGALKAAASSGIGPLVGSGKGLVG